MATTQNLKDDFNRRFKEARSLFDAADYLSARDAYREIQDLVAPHCSVERFGAPLSEGLIRCSVVVLSHRHNDNVRLCLDALSQEITDADEIILVANGNEKLAELGQARFADGTIITTPVTVGCGMGRNIGADHARGHWVIFIDDDGIPEDGCIEALLSCARETDAVSVRGRVLPITQNPHSILSTYDLGLQRSFSLCNAEGVSCFVTSSFKAFNGFEPVLAGHEGVELCARMWRFFGPSGFQYEPPAVLLHDYVDGEQDKVKKEQGYAMMRACVQEMTPTTYQTHEALAHHPHLPCAEALAHLATPLEPSRQPFISVLTTAYNAQEFVADFVQGWHQQTYENFEIIVVDDGSQDETVAAFNAHGDLNGKLQLFACAHTGRTNSLNEAIKQARGEIFAIADVDDISIPSRLTMTANYFLENPDKAIVSFVTFGDGNICETGGRPYDPAHRDMRTRLLFGTPGRFPGYAFRKSMVTIPFDDDHFIGEDLGWVLNQMLADRSLQGEVLPMPVAYYRRHEQSITIQNPVISRNIREVSIRKLFNHLLTTVDEQDDRLIQFLITNDRRLNEVSAKEANQWITKLLRANGKSAIFDPVQLEAALRSSFASLSKVSFATPSKPAKPKTERSAFTQVMNLRRRARRLLDENKDGEARKILTSLKRGSRGLYRQQLQASRKKAVRSLAKSVFGKQPVE
ncbi:MAG: glycosyltransferase [Pseudomonadota bacterium]